MLRGSRSWRPRDIQDVGGEKGGLQEYGSGYGSGLSGAGEVTPRSFPGPGLGRVYAVELDVSSRIDGAAARRDRVAVVRGRVVLDPDTRRANGFTTAT